MTINHCTLAALLTLTVGCDDPEPAQTDLIEGTTRRTPAEWEPQAAVWLQWPSMWEGGAVQDSFVEIVRATAPYERINLVAGSTTTQSRGEEALAGITGDITWHVIDTDSSWMRDNGPRYVEVDGQLVIQNWEFNGWGGGFGNVPYDDDNAMTDVLADMLALPLEQVSLIHERGDLEVNGTDTAMVSWSVLSQRNPELSQDEITQQLQEALGVTSVIYLEGFDPYDGTRGHVDGMARFISEDTIVVGENGTQLLEDIATQIADQRPDLNLIRMSYSSDMDPYMNWLVGDGFVITGSGSDDAAARKHIETYFPGRAVHFVDIGALWRNGGGVHCVTNDQPEAP
ncbi:MAG: agmatine deiminase [Myxococcota bacterium]|jgi:agmatine deiminase